MKEIDLNSLSLFVEVARNESFIEAATKLQIPASTVSRKIRILEEQLGVKLLERTTRNVKLTAAGKIWQGSVKESLQQIQRTILKTERLKSEPEGTIKVTSTLVGATGFLPELIAKFRKKHTKIKFEIFASPQPVDLVENSIDVAFRVGESLRDSNYRVRKLATFSYIFCASPAYLKKSSKITEVSDLEKHELILRVGVVKKSGKLKVQSNKRSTDFIVQCGIVASDHPTVMAHAVEGAGIALLPELEVAKHLKSGKLQRVLPTVIQRKANLYCLTSRNDHRPLYLNLFLQECIRYFNESRETHPPMS